MTFISTIAMAIAQVQAGQEVVSSPAATAPTIAARTEVQIELGEPIDSKSRRIGDEFAIRLAAPVIVDGAVVLPAGLPGRGQIVHVAQARWGGKPGELILAARYLLCGETRIPLGYFRLGGTGKDNTGAAAAAGAAVAVFLPFLISGGEIAIPSRTRASARVTAAIALPQPCSIPEGVE